MVVQQAIIVLKCQENPRMHTTHLNVSLNQSLWEHLESKLLFKIYVLQAYHFYHLMPVSSPNI